MANAIEKFLEAKISSANEETRFVAMLLLSAKGREDLLSTFTFEKVRTTLAERRLSKWGSKN